MSRLSEITRQQRDQLRENAIKMRTSGTPFIKYENGKFMLGSMDVTDNDFLAVFDRCDAVWICFQSGTAEELVRGNMMDGRIPQKPQGYNDRDEWEKWESGKNKGEPKNPLMLQFELPLITNDDDERAITFKASTTLTRDAVSRLLETVNSEETLRRPYVTLTVAPNPDNVNQMLPSFTIFNYSDDLNDIVLPGDKPDKPASANGNSNSRTAANDPISAGNGATRRHNDMDDDIPF